MQSDKADEFIDMLLARLERIQADSRWAHQASGLRGSLIRALENLEAASRDSDGSLRGLKEAAFQILLHAAREKSGQDSSPYAVSPESVGATGRASGSKTDNDAI